MLQFFSPSTNPISLFLSVDEPGCDETLSNMTFQNVCPLSVHVTVPFFLFSF